MVTLFSTVKLCTISNAFEVLFFFPALVLQEACLAVGEKKCNLKVFDAKKLRNQRTQKIKPLLST